MRPGAQQLVGSAAGPPPDGPMAHKTKAWYNANLPKGEIQERLLYEADGTFVIRDSNSAPGAFAFSCVQNGKIGHRIIEPVADGFRFKSYDQSFPTLAALVTHHSKVLASGLKVKLIDPRPFGMVQANFEQRQAEASSGGGGGDTGGGGGSILNEHTWNCMTLDRASALKRLEGKPAGAFVVRPSDKAHCAISMNKPGGGQFHQHIESVAGGLRLKGGATSVHADLHAFVTFYAKAGCPDLPCPFIDI